jgi:hypothetical protein
MSASQSSSVSNGTSPWPVVEMTMSTQCIAASSSRLTASISRTRTPIPALRAAGGAMRSTSSSPFPVSLA